MDLNNINLHESKHENDDDVAAPGELLEDCWFFGNLLQTKSKSSRMLRSFSDPCSSSSFPGKSYEETYESIKKTNRTTAAAATRERRSNRKVLLSSSSSSAGKNLVRAPSLPTSLESDHDLHDDEEMEFSMGKLIRQASLNYSDTRPPRRNAAKSVTPSSSLTRQKSRRKPEMESMKSEVDDQLKTQRSVKDLDIDEELHGFKDLGFDSEEKLEMGSNAVSIERRGARPPYLSAPPVPRWGGKRSTEDMKAQIKFWARAVASNVRQEC